jgi:hypothetical protein
MITNPMMTLHLCPLVSGCLWTELHFQTNPLAILDWSFDFDLDLDTGSSTGSVVFGV